MRIVLLLVSIGLFCTESFSQSSDSLKTPDTAFLNEVVVTGSKIETDKRKIPFSISQINRQQIEHTGETNLLPVLNNYVPGIFVTQRNILGFGVANGGSGGISIRGVGGAPNTGVLVLIDGHPQFQGIFGHPLADAYVTTDVQKVEIVRGPASMLYGTNAMGGVINIITRQNEQEGFNGGAGATYGSFNTQKYYGTAEYKKDKWNLFASVNHDRTDGIRDSTDFKISNGFVKLGYQINNKFLVTADVMLAKYDANDNGSIYNPAFFNIDILRGETSLTLANTFAKSEGAFKLYHNFGKHNLSDGFKSTDRNSGIMLFQTFKLIKNNLFTVGADAKQYGGKANAGKAKDTLKTIEEVAAYINMQQSILKIVTLNVGIRAERNSVWGMQWVPSGGVAVSPVVGTTLKAGISKGFRSPTMMELYLYASNPNLKPENMLNYEVSWLQKLVDNKMNMELTGFIINGKNMIQVTGAPPNLIRQNTGSFNNKGVEISLNYVPSASLQFHSNYSYLHQKTITLAAPRQQFNFNVNYQYKIWNVFSNIQYINKLYSSLSPADIQTYTLWNTRVSASPLKRLTVFAGVNNILNQSYQINYGYPMPWRNYTAGLHVRF